MSIELRPYRIEDEPKLLSLEAACPQGRHLELVMHRKVFAARAQSFGCYDLMVATQNQMIIGVGGVAKLPVQDGDSLRQSSYFFDFRVHPNFRRQGIGESIYQELRQGFESKFGLNLRVTTAKYSNHITHNAAHKQGLDAYAQPFWYLSLSTRQTIQSQSLQRVINTPTPRQALSFKLLENTSDSLYTQITKNLWAWRVDRLYSLEIRRISLWIKPFLKLANSLGPRRGTVPSEGDLLSFVIIYGVSLETLSELPEAIKILQEQNVDLASIALCESDPCFSVLKTLALDCYAYRAYSNQAPSATPRCLDLRCL